VATAGYRGFVEVAISNADVRSARPEHTSAAARERSATVLGRGRWPAGAAPAARVTADRRSARVSASDPIRAPAWL
jgi:hypothetical protein